MLPAGAITVIGSPGLHVLEAIFLLKRRDFEFTVVQMFEAFTQEQVICRSQKQNLNVPRFLGRTEEIVCSLMLLSSRKA